MLAASPQKMTDARPNTQDVAVLHSLSGIPGRSDLSLVFDNYNDGEAAIPEVWAQVRLQLIAVLERQNLATDMSAALLAVFDAIANLNLQIWRVTTDFAAPLTAVLQDNSDVLDELQQAIALVTNEFDQNPQLLSNWKNLTSALTQAELQRLTGEL